MAGYYRPAHQTQLNDGTPTAGRNCAVHSVSMAVDGGTYGAVIPTVRQVRVACEQPTTGLTTADYRQAIEALLPADIERHYYVRPSRVIELREDLEAGYGAVLALAYGLVPKAYSCQPTFKGNHAVYVYGWRWLDGLRQVRVSDPLCDGRTRWYGTVADKPQLVPLRIVLEAAAAFAGGTGLFTGATVARPPKA